MNEEIEEIMDDEEDINASQETLKMISNTLSDILEWFNSNCIWSNSICKVRVQDIRVKDRSRQGRDSMMITAVIVSSDTGNHKYARFWLTLPQLIKPNNQKVIELVRQLFRRMDNNPKLPASIRVTDLEDYILEIKFVGGARL